MKKVTIVAAMHGDETYGVELFDAFCKEQPGLAEYVQLIIGNEKAYKENVRYIDCDMNRNYADRQEGHELEEINRVDSLIHQFDPDYIIDIHTTRRNSGVFLISGELNEVREKICNMLDLDVCTMGRSIVKHSLIGSYKNAASLEYSLRAISRRTTEEFVQGLTSLIQDLPKKNSIQKVFSVDKLISQNEWKAYPGLQNYETKTEGVALMVPANESEMDAEYYGFWCKEVA